MVGLASVCCDWVRHQTSSATSISVWQHTYLSVQIHPKDRLACCRNMQPSNPPTNTSAHFGHRMVLLFLGGLTELCCKYHDDKQSDDAKLNQEYHNNKLRHENTKLKICHKYEYQTDISFRKNSSGSGSLQYSGVMQVV